MQQDVAEKLDSAINATCHDICSIAVSSGTDTALCEHLCAIVGKDIFSSLVQFVDTDPACACLQVRLCNAMPCEAPECIANVTAVVNARSHLDQFEFKTTVQSSTLLGQTEFNWNIDDGNVLLGTWLSWLAPGREYEVDLYADSSRFQSGKHTAMLSVCPDNCSRGATNAYINVTTQFSV